MTDGIVAPTSLPRSGRPLVPPAGGHSLSDAWARRDLRYAKRSAFQQLSAAGVMAVRTFRIAEASDDPAARAIAVRWTPPERMS